VTERGLEVHRSLYYVKQIPVESGLERKDFFYKKSFLRNGTKLTLRYTRVR